MQFSRCYDQILYIVTFGVSRFCIYNYYTYMVPVQFPLLNRSCVNYTAIDDTEEWSCPSCVKCEILCLNTHQQTNSVQDTCPPTYHLLPLAS